MLSQEREVGEESLLSPDLLSLGPKQRTWGWIVLKRVLKLLSNLVIELQSIVRAIFTHRCLAADENLPNTDKKPDQVASPGLIRFTRLGGSTSGFLTAPYIWIWMLAESDGKGGKSLLPHWLFDDYDEHLSIGDKTLPAGSLSWENFERFNAFFRCIKSSTLNEGELTKISEIHYGARLNGDVEFRNHHLRLDAASRREDTRSTGKNSREWMVSCEHQTV